MTDHLHQTAHRKMIAINAIIAVGCLVILVLSVMSGTASNGNLINTLFLTVITAGIPMVLFAAGAYLLLSFLLFKPGEREAYVARKDAITQMRAAEHIGAASPRPPENHPSSGGDKYAD